MRKLTTKQIDTFTIKFLKGVTESKNHYANEIVRLGHMERDEGINTKPQIELIDHLLDNGFFTILNGITPKGENLLTKTISYNNAIAKKVRSYMPSNTGEAA